MLLLLVGCGSESTDDPGEEEENASSEATTEPSQSTTVGIANLTRLTYDIGYPQYPDVSPDGTKIVFQSRWRTPSRKGGWLNGPWVEEIYAVNADGTGLTQLTDLVTARYPELSPDGTKIAFEGQGIRVINVDDTGPTVTTQGVGRPTWSPDGTKIAFLRSESGADLGRARSDGVYVINADGTGLAPLQQGFPPGAPGPIWSPEGSKIIFNIASSPPQFLPDTYMMNADGTGLTRPFTDNRIQNRVQQPVFSPDGAKIAFHSREASTPANPQPYADIYVMNADGTGLTNITNSPQVEDVEATFTPDGKKIAFRSNPVWDDEIYLMNLDGTDPVNLTNRESTYDHSPTFSADGKKLVFASRWFDPDRGSNPDPVQAIYIADFSSG